MSEQPNLDEVVVDRSPRPLPRFTATWFGLVVLSAAALGFGVYAYSQQLLHGDIVTGLRNPGYGGGAWGFYIVFYVYFVGVSFAGITVAAMARLFHIDTLKPVSRMAELLTIVALIAGAAMVMADLGRPMDGLLKLPMLARPMSPFYGTFTLVVSGYLFSSLVYFIVAGRHDAARMSRGRHPWLRWFYLSWASGYRGTAAEHARHGRTTFWLSLTILPLLIIAHSTLGFIFGIQSGRPGWFSALQAPGFVVLAGVSGIGALILMAVGFRKLFKLDFPDEPIHWLGNLLWVLALSYLYFMIVEELTGTYAAPKADRHVAHEVVGGHFAPLFWFTVAALFITFVVPFALYLSRRKSLRWLVVASIAANIGAIAKRLLIVVPSQTHGALMQVEEGNYWPTWVEWGVVAGMTGFLLLALLVFGKIFPLVPSKVPPLSRTGPLPRERGRRVITLLWGLFSLGLITFGLADSFRLFSGNELDTKVPFSPAIFAVGVIFLFSTAIVYEALPRLRRPLRRHPRPRVARVTARRSVRTLPRPIAKPVATRAIREPLRHNIVRAISARERR